MQRHAIPNLPNGHPLLDMHDAYQGYVNALRVYETVIKDRQNGKVAQSDVAQAYRDCVRHLDLVAARAARYMGFDTEPVLKFRQPKVFTVAPSDNNGRDGS